MVIDCKLDFLIALGMACPHASLHSRPHECASADPIRILWNRERTLSKVQLDMLWVLDKAGSCTFETPQVKDT